VVDKDKIGEIMAKRKIISLVVGGPGEGKTHFACSHPKCVVVVTEPNTEETWLNKEELRKNVIDWRSFIPDKDNLEVSLKSIYGNPADSTLIKYLNEVRERAKKGEVETLVLDNATYFVKNKWDYIEHFEVQKTKMGETNTMAMYGALRNWNYEFFRNYILTFPGNVCITAHQIVEHEEAMEKKVDKSLEIVPDIMGSFRNDIMGLVSNVFFLIKEVKKENGVWVKKYNAITEKIMQRGGKNRCNLPPIVENVNYARIRLEMDNAMKGVK